MTDGFSLETAPVDEAEIVEIAKRIVAEREAWADQAIYNPYQYGDGWMVGVLQVDYGSDGETILGASVRRGVVIDGDGRIVEYTNGPRR
jgi:hypothetical protein